LYISKCQHDIDKIVIAGQAKSLNYTEATSMAICIRTLQINNTFIERRRIALALRGVCWKLVLLAEPKDINNVL